MPLSRRFEPLALGLKIKNTSHPPPEISSQLLREQRGGIIEKYKNSFNMLETGFFLFF